MPIEHTTTPVSAPHYPCQDIVDFIAMLIERISAIFACYIENAKFEANKTKINNQITILTARRDKETTPEGKREIQKLIHSVKTTRWALDLSKAYEAARKADRKSVDGVIDALENDNRSLMKRLMQLPAEISHAHALLLDCPKGTELPKPIQEAFDRQLLSKENTIHPIVDPEKMALAIAFFKSLK